MMVSKPVLKKVPSSAEIIIILPMFAAFSENSTIYKICQEYDYVREKLAFVNPDHLEVLPRVTQLFELSASAGFPRLSIDSMNTVELLVVSGDAFF